VVASFMVSFGLTYMAIIVAYIFRLFPESRYNSIDLAVSRNLSPLRSNSFPLRLPQWHSTRDSRTAKETRIKRVRAFESFILAMSDQQLITGVALLIVTTYMTFSELGESFSVYPFQVATRLGYCSCIVHLCTICLLREHFDANNLTHSHSHCYAGTASSGRHENPQLTESKEVSSGRCGDEMAKL
ncbi:hypothetical protein CSHISOI_06633, partial [Colletotrichum shisoi]